ncbi:MAG: DUF6531 domain-containing protein [Acidobacteriia bacterium]|nr:DUF6531 domain-containing protein [Terriglobia bacterium]
MRNLFSGILAALPLIGGTLATPRVPVYFEPNEGQFDAEIQMGARAAGYRLLLVDGGVVVQPDRGAARVEMRFEGASHSSGWTAETGAAAVTNYLVGDSTQWRTGVRHFERARLNGIYPGIDFVIHGSGERLEYDFVVHPGADPSAIRYRVTGADVRLSPEGDLILASGGQQWLHRRPSVYQRHGSETMAVSGNFRVEGSTIGFDLGAYDRTRDLVIDPLVVYKNLGGNYSWAAAAVTDAAGNIYVTGWADSSLQATAGVAQKTYGGGNTDAIVVKFSNSGVLQWLTYLGGSGDDRGGAIAIDGAGNVVVMGTTGSTNFPIAGTPIQGTNAGGADAFVAKLDPNGSKLLFSTYFGGGGDENVTSGMLDAQGNILFGGYTPSGNLKSAGTPVQSKNAGGAADVFLVRMKGDGSALSFVTYLGGSGDDLLMSMALDAGGNIYLAGFTTSSNLPATSGAMATKSAGSTDGFAAKLDPNASTVMFLTYLGGSGSDMANGIAPLADGSVVWVTGATQSTNFPTSSKAIQKSLAGDFDAFLTKLDAKGAMLASTYLGGLGPDSGDAVVISNGLPVMIGVLTTNQYDKPASSAIAEPVAFGLSRKSDLSQPELALETMSDDASAVAASTTFSAPPPVYYVGNSRCASADGNTVACAGAGFPADETGNPQGAVLVATVGSPNAPPAGFIPQTRRETSASDVAPDPVDGATGHFHDSMADMKLGGPLRLGFARYYSSGLSAGGFKSILGTNWMSNFDLRLTVSGTNAQVLLFGGETVSFTSSNGAWQLASPNAVAYQFIQSGSNYKLMNPADKLIYTFNAAGALTTIEDRRGNAITITLGPNGPASATDGLGRTLSFTYAGTLLTRVQDQTSRSVLFGYTGNLLTSATDVNSQVWNYTYTSAGSLIGLMTKKQYPLGEVLTTQTYDSNGRVISQVDPLNRASNISYDSAGGSALTDANGGVTKHGNDANGDLTQLTDPTGAAAKVSYDGSNRRTSVTDKLGSTRRYTYHAASGYLASSTDALGNPTSFTYAAQAQAGFTFYVLTGITYADGSSESFTYDATGNRLSRTLRDGTKASFTYDGKGQLTMVTFNGGTTTYAWNADSTLASVTDALGNKTTNSYDALKRLVQQTAPNGAATTIAYDAADHVISRTDGAGTTVSRSFDADSRLSSATNATGGKYAIAYTPTGRLSSTTDPLGHKSSYTYDVVDRLATSTNGAGDSLTSTYDAVNRVASITDGAGVVTSYSYDAESNLVATTDGTGRKWTYNYDANGRAVASISPGGNKTAISYDSNGRPMSSTNALGETQALTRNAMGQITGSAVAGISTSITRNPNGPPASITDPNGNTTSYSYDADQQLSKVTDPLGNATSFAYSKELLSSATLPLGTVAFTRDADGRITKKQYSDGTVVNTTYDANGLRTSLDGVSVTRNVKGEPTSINGIGITLDAAGRPATLTYAAGKTVTYAYDGGGRVTSITDWTGAKTTFSYDPAGRVTSVKYPNSVANSYTYDSDNRIAQIAFGNLGSVSLTRDAAGKILSANRNLPASPSLKPGAQQFTYDAAEQVSGGAAYDTMGRATSQNGRNYTWNLASQMTGFSDASTSATLTYDGIGEISSMTSSGSTRSFVFNYLLPLPALSIVRQGSSDLRYYVYTPHGRLLYSIEASGNAHHFYHFDEMGNTALLTDDSGAVSDSYAITPYGEIADHTGATDNPFTWQGEFGAMQEAPGLYYLRSRHYEAAAGRFLSRDAFTGAGVYSANPYPYANGNPLAFVDPSGNSAKWTDSPDAVALFTTAKSLYKAEGLFVIADPVFLNIVAILQTLAGNPDMTWDDLENALNPPPPQPPPPPPAPTPPPKPAQPIIASSTSKDVLGTAPNLLGGIAGTGAAGLIGQDSAGLIGQDSAGLIGQDSAGLIGQDSAGLIGQDSAGLIGQDSAGLIGQDSAGLIGQDSAGLIGQDSAGLIRRDSAVAIRAPLAGGVAGARKTTLAPGRASQK